jgi:hypothetical protein
MADFQQELQNRQNTWTKFVKSFFWSAGIIAVLFLLLWIFLV